MNENKFITSGKDEPMDVDTTSQKLQASNILHNVYAKSVFLKEELSSTEIQAVVGNNNGKLQSAFNNFQNILNKHCQQQKVSARPKRQATLTNIFL